MCEYCTTIKPDESSSWSQQKCLQNNPDLLANQALDAWHEWSLLAYRYGCQFSTLCAHSCRVITISTDLWFSYTCHNISVQSARKTLDTCIADPVQTLAQICIGGHFWKEMHDADHTLLGLMAGLFLLAHQEKGVSMG